MRSLGAVLEQWRLQAHLWSVEIELRHREPAGLSTTQRKARQANIDRLHAYWKRGQFPKNRRFYRQFAPFIRDDRGIPCAVAHLLAESHRGNLVDHLAAANNHVFLSTVKEGPLLNWLEESGLTQREAARIQPSYPGSGSIGPDPTELLLQFIFEARWWIAGISAGMGLSGWLAYLLVKRLLPWMRPWQFIGTCGALAVLLTAAGWLFLTPL